MEIALTLPVLVLVALATIDTCQVLYLKQSAKIAAYEGARACLISGATQADVHSQCSTLLDGRSVQGYTVSIPDLTTVQYGQPLAIQVAVPADQNSLVSSWFYRGRVFSETVVVMAEL